MSTSLVACNLLALCSQFHGFCYFLFTDGSTSHGCSCKVQTLGVVVDFVAVDENVLWLNDQWTPA